MAELVDASGLGPGDCKVVGVRVPSPAPLNQPAPARETARSPTPLPTNELLSQGEKMQVTEETSEGLKRGYKIVVAASDIGSRIENRLTEVGAKARLPGFRPGKIPMKVLKQRFGQSVTAEVLEGAVRDSSTEVLQDRGLRPAQQPKIEITAFDEGKDLEYDMNVEILPDVEPMDLSTLEVERIKPTVSDADVQEALERLAASQRRTKPVEGERAAVNGDVVVLDFIGRIDGETFEGGTAEDFHLELGSGTFLPGFEDQLTGAVAGGSVEVKVAFPEDYPKEELAGKPAVFDCGIKEIRVPDPMGVDDELAKAVGMDDIAALKDAMREQVGRELGQVARNRLKRQLLDKLEAEHSFEVPPGMVDSEFETIWKQVEEAREQDRLDPDDKGKSEDDLREAYRKIAMRRVRLGLILSEVGQRNNLSVTQDEINQAIMQEARRHPGQEQKVVDFFRTNQQALAGLQAPIFEDKVIDFIAEMANVTEREASSGEIRKLQQEEAAAAES